MRDWRRPSPSQTVFAQLLEHLPETMEVRVIERAIRRAGYRTWTLRIATSLLDPVLYPADELVEFYLRRWRIETTLRTLKTHGHMARLTGKTPDIARKEIHCAVLAHNCVCALMVQSGEAPEPAEPQTRARSDPDLHRAHGICTDAPITDVVPHAVADDRNRATNAAGTWPRAPRDCPTPQHFPRAHDLAIRMEDEAKDGLRKQHWAGGTGTLDKP